MVQDPDRLAALDRLRLLDSPAEPAFDRLTRLAATILKTPVALVSLVAAERQFFKSAVGLDEPWATLRETPLSYSFCQYVVNTAQPLIVSDARQDPLLRTSPAIPDLNVIAYAGIPLVTSEGHVLGSFCAIDFTPRTWTPEEIGILQDLAAAVTTEIELRSKLLEHKAALMRTEVLYQSARSLTAIENLADLLQTVVDDTGAALAANRMALIVLDYATQRIEYVVVSGPGSHQVVAVSIGELNAGLTGWVLRTLQPALSPKDAPDPREGPDVQQRRRETGCGAIMVTPLIYRGAVIGTMTAARTMREPDFSPADLELMVAITNQAAIAITNAKLFQQVQHMAMTDGLTNLYNRRGFFEVGQHFVERVQRLRGGLVALIFDVDHFKTVNDTHGHAVGDQVLMQLAERCQAQLRKMDILGRYGGEEFAALLPDTDFQLALKVAERLRAAVAATPILTQAGPIAITISIGVARWADDLADLAALLDRADHALYQAKAAGRNCIRIA
jgi:diguanylate cyclase (GGDEF)-like protein